MREIRFKPDFRAWRNEARRALESEIPPPEIIWKSNEEDQAELEGLFAANPSEDVIHKPSKKYVVPPAFLEMAPFVAAHRDSARWNLLYRLLWRITHGEPDLLKISIDAAVAEFHSMFRSVRRDMHKMKAFVRFRETRDIETHAAHFVAWYAPDHLIVRLIAPFFAERFKNMHWSILTEDECAHWDGETLTFTPGCPKSLAPKGDEVETLWKTYYASIFNPARIKLQAMRKELPVRYWKNLPETELIRGLIHDAPARLQDFYENQPRRAEEWASADQCRACPIGASATQAVMGEGPRNAKIILIGEQPGDQEDQIGRPFQGPAGQLLDRALEAAEINRSELFITNAVKHFKWTPQGKYRLHQKPSSAEIAACKPWLAAELAWLQPEVIICLGATAAQSVFGKQVTIRSLRDGVHSTGWCKNTVVTVHPSAILRTSDAAEQKKEFDQFVDDLIAARRITDERSADRGHP